MKNFDSIEEALNVDTEVVENDKIEPRKNQLKKSDQNDSEKDYEYSRANLYSLVEKGQEAVNGILELAQESDSARAYEVAAKHEHNASIGVLSATDNASIEFGDDFGFDEMSSFFSDGKEFSPSQGIDI